LGGNKRDVLLWGCSKEISPWKFYKILRWTSYFQNYVLENDSEDISGFSMQNAINSHTLGWKCNRCEAVRPLEEFSPMENLQNFVLDLRSLNLWSGKQFCLHAYLPNDMISLKTWFLLCLILEVSCPWALTEPTQFLQTTQL
jgi:hypothetical protein